MANVFDEFDPPQRGPKPVNPFDQFDVPARPAAPAAPVTMQEMAPVYDAMGNVTGYDAPAMADPGMAYGEQMGNVGSVVDDGVRLGANGMTFNLADKAAGGMDALTGKAGSYDEGVTAQRDRTQAIRDAHPGLALAAEAAGGLATGAGLVKNGVTLAGRAASMVPRILAYGTEGGLYGAAHGAGSTYSDDWWDYADNAGHEGVNGLLIGGGLPLAGKSVSGAARGLLAMGGPAVAGTSRAASTLLRGAAQADEAGIRALPSMGDEAMLVDAGPAMLGLGQGAATGIGPGRSELVNALAARDAATGPRLAATLDAQLGPAPIPSQVEAGYASGRKQLSPIYEAVLDKAKAVNTQSLADDLDSAAANLRGPARDAVVSARRFLDIPGTDHLDPSPRALLETRHAIDGMTKDIKDTNVLRVLGMARGRVDNELQRAVPDIKKVDAAHAELAKRSEALEQGQTIFDTDRATAIRPQELSDSMAAMSPGQNTALQAGARAEVDRRVGTNVNDLNALERTFGTPEDWNYQKMGSVFGTSQRDAVAEALTTNRRFRDSHQKIVQGSQTAQRRAADEAMNRKSNIPLDTTATGLGMRAVIGAARMVSNASKEAVKEQIARVLAEQGAPAQRTWAALLAQARTAQERAAIIQAAIAHPAYLGASAPAYGRR